MKLAIAKQPDLRAQNSPDINSLLVRFRNNFLVLILFSCLFNYKALSQGLVTQNHQLYVVDSLKLAVESLFGDGKIDSAEMIARHMLQISQKIVNSDRIAEAHYLLAKCMDKKGKLSNASTHIVEAIRLSEKSETTLERGKYYYFLSDIFFKLRDGERSALYSRKAGQAFKKNSDDFFERNRIDTIIHQILQGKSEIALKHLARAEEKVSPLKEPYIFSKVKLYKSHVYYLDKQYDRSLASLNECLPYLEAAERQYFGIRLHVEAALSQTLLAMKRYNQARYYFDRNINRAVKEMDQNDIRDCFKIGSEIYEGLGDYRKSLQYLKKSNLYNDSINNLGMKKSIHETEIKYRTALKEKSISEQNLLLVKKDFELQKKNRILIYSFAALLALTSVTIIIYLANRNRHQSIELSVLKAQIHPHFLFNTLNNLYALTRRKADDAPSVVLGLSNILRYMLYECNTSKVALQKDIDIIVQYISLEKIRYEDSLEVNTDLDSNFSGHSIAPLLLLPLVENAYKHGASKLQRDAWINVSAQVKEGRFIFKISNNTPVDQSISRDETIYGNIGLNNIKKRLAILYPKRHKIKITHSEDMFVVTLELKFT